MTCSGYSFSQAGGLTAARQGCPPRLPSSRAQGLDFAALQPNISALHCPNQLWSQAHAMTEELWKEGSWAADLTP